MKIILSCLAAVLLLPVSAFPDATGNFGPLLSINLTTPQVFSVSVGLAYRFDDEERRSAWSKGIMAQVEPGMGGTKFYVGFFRGVGGWSDAGLAWAVKYSVLRTHDDLGGVAANQTYVGWELEGALVPLLKLSAGAYHHTAGNDPDEWLYSMAVGYGF